MKKHFLALAVITLIALPQLGHGQNNFNQNPMAQNTSLTNDNLRLNNLEDQIRTLTGKIEELQFQIGQMKDTIDKTQSDHDVRFTQIENRLATTEEQIKSQQSAPAPMDEKNKSADKKDTKPHEPAQESYDHAFALLRSADYDGAEKAFRDFIKQHPKHDHVGNAKYWYGETFYVRDNFSNAAKAFANSYADAPEGSKAPDSLLKLGLSLKRLKKNKEACTTFLSLDKQFPHANVILKNRANQEMKQLKCKKPNA